MNSASLPLAESVAPVQAVVLASDVNGLGAVRSLHEAGIQSVLVTHKPMDPGLLSRVPSRTIVADSTGSFEESLLCALKPLGTGCPVLIPTSDLYVGFMISQREKLGRMFRFILPDDRVVQSLLDKEKETELMEQLQIPIARTVRRLHEHECEWWKGLRFPLILKPRMSAYVHHLKAKNRILRSPAEAELFTKEHQVSMQFFLAQEVISGGDSCQWVCNCAFSRKHELLRAFTFQRLHLSPAHFGVTSLAVSRRNGAVLDLVQRIGRSLEYVGPAMLEFKYDQQDGLYKYIELNPRLGMCNYFDTSCGVNNVEATFRLACGEELARRDGQREGVYYLCWFEDLFARYKDGEPLRAIFRNHLSVLVSRHTSAYWCWYDPLPGIVMFWRNAVSVGRSALRKLFRLARAVTSAGVR
jgi:D-aspartate ligase